MSPQTLDLDYSSKEAKALRRRMASEYQRVVVELSSQVKEWIQMLPGWTATQELTIERPPQTGGGMFIPKTTIDTPDGRLVLEPMGFSFGQNAIVDFLAWPSSYHVRLLHDLSAEGTWRVRTESGIFLRQPWNRENFLHLAQDLLAADWE